MSTELNNALSNTNAEFENGSVHISKAEGFAGLVGLYKVYVNGDIQYMDRYELKRAKFYHADLNKPLNASGDATEGIHAQGDGSNDTMANQGSHSRHGHRADFASMFGVLVNS